jgi:hypothetical protein
VAPGRPKPCGCRSNARAAQHTTESPCRHWLGFARPHVRALLDSRVAAREAPAATSNDIAPLRVDDDALRPPAIGFDPVTTTSRRPPRGLVPRAPQHERPPRKGSGAEDGPQRAHHDPFVVTYGGAPAARVCERRRYRSGAEVPIGDATDAVMDRRATHEISQRRPSRAPVSRVAPLGDDRHAAR